MHHYFQMYIFCSNKTLIRPKYVLFDTQEATLSASEVKQLWSEGKFYMAKSAWDSSRLDDSIALYRELTESSYTPGNLSAQASYDVAQVGYYFNYLI